MNCTTQGVVRVRTHKPPKAKPLEATEKRVNVKKATQRDEYERQAES